MSKLIALTIRDTPDIEVTEPKPKAPCFKEGDLVQVINPNGAEESNATPHEPKREYPTLDFLTVHQTSWVLRWFEGYKKDERGKGVMGIKCGWMIAVVNAYGQPVGVYRISDMRIIPRGSGEAREYLQTINELRSGHS